MLGLQGSLLFSDWPKGGTGRSTVVREIIRNFQAARKRFLWYVPELQTYCGDSFLIA